MRDDAELLFNGMETHPVVVPYLNVLTSIRRERATSTEAGAVGSTSPSIRDRLLLDMLNLPQINTSSFNFEPFSRPEERKNAVKNLRRLKKLFRMEAEWLLTIGADVETRHPVHGTLLFRAVCQEDLALVTVLIQKYGARITDDLYEAPDDHMINRLFSCLTKAVTLGSHRIVNFLFKSGANLECSDPGYGTSLFQAAARNDSCMVELLLRLGVAVTPQLFPFANEWRSCISHAALIGSLRMVKLLLQLLEGSMIAPEVMFLVVGDLYHDQSFMEHTDELEIFKLLFEATSPFLRLEHLAIDGDLTLTDVAFIAAVTCELAGQQILFKTIQVTDIHLPDSTMMRYLSDRISPYHRYFGSGYFRSSHSVKLTLLQFLLQIGCPPPSPAALGYALKHRAFLTLANTALACLQAGITMVWPLSSSSSSDGFIKAATPEWAASSIGPESVGLLIRILKFAPTNTAHSMAEIQTLRILEALTNDASPDVTKRTTGENPARLEDMCRGVLARRAMLSTGLDAASCQRYRLPFSQRRKLTLTPLTETTALQVESFWNAVTTEATERTGEEDVEPDNYGFAIGEQ
ncbi:hypothetical protein BV898_08858 [Hypsibius exemplaris]|uniref:Uncharacterized protein n=1 Tax=Hypsibius exemplaris TaxID=2072580 RepID=A0A1W0WPC3_HYPEX|nr:hypothetical protein BV898_08858 [Hypsibius exemplaris]